MLKTGYAWELIQNRNSWFLSTNESYLILLFQRTEQVNQLVGICVYEDFIVVDVVVIIIVEMSVSSPCYRKLKRFLFVWFVWFFLCVFFFSKILTCLCVTLVNLFIYLRKINRFYYWRSNRINNRIVFVFVFLCIVFRVWQFGFVCVFTSWEFR